ncbi:hypothetical protein BaRGS_00022592 [Batillaria attramentaria]|uniref:Uncharacterized protein n=1 Tax=Batillaria attramentaria TaxID=370345 RepID=A0ABD0KGM0_9CAEN
MYKLSGRRQFRQEPNPRVSLGFLTLHECSPALPPAEEAARNHGVPAAGAWRGIGPLMRLIFSRNPIVTRHRLPLKLNFNKERQLPVTHEVIAPAVQHSTFYFSLFCGEESRKGEALSCS